MNRVNGGMGDALSRKVRIGTNPSKGGRGLFAAEALAAGELVWVGHLFAPGAKFFHWNEIRNDPAAVRYAYQIGEDLFSIDLEDTDPSNFLNHSCAPNTWYDYSRGTKLQYVVDHVVPGRAPAIVFDTLAEIEKALEIEYLVARTGIPVGCEITMDYSTFWTVSDLAFVCRCDASECRGRVAAQDYRRHDPAHVSRYVQGLLTQGSVTRGE